MNLGVPAAGTQDVIDSQLQKAISDTPDVVTMLIGINDVQNLVSREVFRRNIERTIDAIQSKTKAKIVVINLPFLGTDDLVTWPFRWAYRLRVTAFNRILEQIAKNKGLTLIDLNKATQDKAAHNSDYYSIDQFHPSAKGYQQWSDIIYAHASF
jgi:lysophospholipase L1-like esterase